MEMDKEAINFHGANDWKCLKVLTNYFFRPLLLNVLEILQSSRCIFPIIIFECCCLSSQRDI